jgi:hypothetical protein
MDRKCYECLKRLEGEDFRVVEYPAKDPVEGGTAVYEEPTVTVILCETCYQENEGKAKVVG